MKKLIVFDCDSTLSSIEGVDELARFKGDGVFRQVKELTTQAMDGHIPLEEVFRRRMELIRPSRADMEHIAEQYKRTLADGARELIQHLQQKSWQVVIVSGGLYPPVKALADDLGVGEVMAVPVEFDEAGKYQNFDDQYYTARSGGKPECIHELKRKYQSQQVVMVGDGVSDLETKSQVDLFVGYGEFVTRDTVRSESEHFVMSMKELSGVLEEFGI